MIRKSIHKIILVVITLLFFTISSQAQFSSEEELKTVANNMFKEEKYVEALPLFSQLLSLYPKDPSYNYKYGTCILYGSRNKDDALKYLKFAVTKANVDPIAFYFLAKAYHHNYQFSPAIVNFNKYKGKSTAKEHQKYKITRETEMCKNGERLLKSMTDIGVLSKKEIKKSDFFRSYKLYGIGGKIIVKPDEFKTKLDIKNNENSVIYLGEKKEMVVFSSYGKGGSRGKDIYKVVKLPDGKWSKPSSLSDNINSNYDEDYPFLHPDGKTLYFSSKGFNSMGGYDIFKSTFNPITGQWSSPENLDFPINTPDDDILYISDINNQLAYFASSRESKQGEITVYKVTVDSPPIENSVIKGFFISESNPNMKSATITVKHAEKDRRYGVYKTHDVTGEYLLTFPKNGGKFKILVETTGGAPVHSAIIELPVLDGFRSLKQELRLVGEGDDEKLVVKNLFDESDEFDINDPLVVQNILKERAKLNVNTTEEEVNNTLANSLNNALENQENSNYSELSDDQIVNKTDGIASKIIEQANTSKKQANISYQIANEKSTKAKELYNEATALYETGDNEQAEVKKLEAAKLINETIAALAIAKTLDNEVVERESDLENVNNLQESINNNIDNGNRTEAENDFEKLEKISSATYHNESALETEEEVANNKLNKKQKAYNKNRDEVTELLNREFELTETINKLEAKKESAKKKSEKEDLAGRIQAIKFDLEDTKFDLANARTQSLQIEVEYNEAKNQLATTKSVITSVNEGSISGVPITESSKLQLENDIAYFDKEGLVGLYPSEYDLTTSSTSSESYNIEEHKDEYEIIDNKGKIIDYNTNYSSMLVSVDNENNPSERAHIIIKINESWIRDIGEEIDIRKNQLQAETNSAKRTELKNKIASLESLRTEKQRELNENNELLAANNSSNITANTAEEVNIINTDGSVIDYEAKYTNELETFIEEDGFDSYTKKAAIHTNWASATEQEILLKKMELAEANEADKNSIENEIAVLENNLLEQQEYAALYDSQAKSVRTTEPIIEEVLVNNKQPIINNEENNNIEEPIANEVTNNTPLVSNGGDNYEQKYTAEINEFTGEDDFDSYTKKAAIHTSWSKAIEEKITTKEIELAGASGEDKNTLENEIAILESDYLEQQEFAALYKMQAESMRTTELVVEEPLANNEEITTSNNETIEEISANETPSELAEENLTVNNMNAPEDDFSNLKYNNNFNYKSTQSQNAIVSVAELKNEARILQDEADVKLNTAIVSSSQEEKDKIIAEANELTEKSNRKQEDIAKIYENANRNEFYNNQTILSNLTKENNDPFSNQVIMTELLVDESNNYYEEAKQKREDATNATNFTSKEIALQKAYELEMKAIEKQKIAIFQLAEGNTEEIYANSENLNISSTNNNEVEQPLINSEELVTSKTEKPIATSNEITPEDQEIILNLQSEEIAEIRSREEYQNYAELKKENRRLIKEAEVEYVKSEKFKEEANDQKQLGISLRAMAEGAATEEDKAKKLAQIEKLEKMIAGNEEKSLELKQGAIDKENLAKEASDKSDFILINAEETDSENYTAIEKAETFDNEFMVEAMNRTGNTTAEEPLANNEQPETNQEEPLANNEETSTIEEPIANNEETNTEESTINNNEPINNNEEPIVNEPTNNTVPENIDEIPTVLNKSIFIINNNQAAYNENKRIPISPKLPEGLVFKVQIGAFRNPIPQNHFKGFAPIMAEDAGNGITRYTAGLFKTFNMANEAKSSIRSIGYSDAFVVAFLNGKRINMGEARAMLDGSTVEEGNFAINTNTPTNNNASNNATTNNTTNTNRVNNIEEVKDGVSTDVRNIDGVFYAVQVGVYSKPVTAGQLNNVSPLNSERTSSGLIRYTSGVFKFLSDANAAKERIRALGISDAFVVAYNGGTKITVAEATNLLVGGGSTNPTIEETPIEETPIEETPVEETPVEETPVEETPVEETPVEETPVEETFKNEIPGYEPKEDLNLEFKVKLGEYEEDVPVEDAGLFLRLTGRGVKSYEKGNKTIYTIGSFPDYESALDLQIEMKEMGVKNPVAIVFRDGVEMSLEEAFKLMKSNQ
ncbi:MAG: hypothetical protein COA97_12705 [Flavobacteriales bacterium]|nr:MAG: hypothetical protein COA97_12705 [Flavobacteriales bacterium]